MSASMAFDAFLERYKWGPAPLRREATHNERAAWEQLWTDELSGMERDRQQVANWDAVPIGARVFVLWGGGNRGVYLRHEDGLGPCPETSSTYRHQLPELGPHRMDARAWVEAVP